MTSLHELLENLDIRDLMAHLISALHLSEVTDWSRVSWPVVCVWGGGLVLIFGLFDWALEFEVFITDGLKNKSPV